MTKRTVILFAAVVSSLLLGACAEAPEKESSNHKTPVYRTGSNIPFKDYRSDNIEVATPDVINPINRPMPSVMNKKPGG